MTNSKAFSPEEPQARGGHRTRRRALAGMLVAGAAFAMSGLAAAQDHRGPITLVVGYPAGGSADLGARILAEKLPALLGQPVLVDNRSGAGGQIAARYVKEAPGNGSVLFFTNSHTVVTVPLILKTPGFDTATDFKPVSLYAGYDLVLVAHPKTHAANLKELAAFFERTPGERSIGVPAPGSAPEFIAGRLAQIMKNDVQTVPYRGSAPLIQDLLGSQVPAAVVPIADAQQYLRSGALKAIALTNASALLPGVPSFADLGINDLAVGEFLAVYAPPSLSDANVQRFNAAIRQVVADPEAAQKLQSYAMQPQSSTPAELAQRQKQMTSTIRGLIQAVHYVPQ